MRRRNVNGQQKRSSSRRNSAVAASGGGKPASDSEENHAIRKKKKSRQALVPATEEVDLYDVVASLGLQKDTRSALVTTPAMSQEQTVSRSRGRVVVEDNSFPVPLKHSTARSVSHGKATRKPRSAALVSEPVHTPTIVVAERSEMVTDVCLAAAEVTIASSADGAVEVVTTTAAAAARPTHLTFVESDTRAGEPTPPTVGSSHHREITTAARRRLPEADMDTEDESAPTPAVNVPGFTSIPKAIVGSATEPSAADTPRKHRASSSRSSSTHGDAATRWMRQHGFSRGRVGSRAREASVLVTSAATAAVASMRARAQSILVRDTPRILSSAQREPATAFLFEGGGGGRRRAEKTPIQEPPPRVFPLSPLDSVRGVSGWAAPPSSFVVALSQFDDGAGVAPRNATLLTTGDENVAGPASTAVHANVPDVPLPPEELPPPPLEAEAEVDVVPTGAAMWTGPQFGYGVGMYVSSTSRRHERAKFYADGGQWLKTLQPCARCGVLFAEESSVGRLLCLAHRYVVPVEGVFPCCGMVTANVATPAWRVGAFRRGNTPFRTGCIPVDHTTSDELASLQRVLKLNTVRETRAETVIALSAPVEGLSTGVEMPPDGGRYPYDPATVYVRKTIIPAA